MASSVKEFMEKSWGLSISRVAAMRSSISGEGNLRDVVIRLII
jgi:hypothetical protein